MTPGDIEGLTGFALALHPDLMDAVKVRVAHSGEGHMAKRELASREPRGPIIEGQATRIS